MALKKSFSTSYRVSAEYWKVARVVYNPHESTCQANLIGFYNQQARTESAESLATKSYTFKDADFDFLPTDNLVAKIYAKIKAMDEWTGSIDV